MINDMPGTEGKLTAVKGNKGYEARLAFLNNSQTVELVGRIHADLFNSDRMLLNGVDMDIKLTRAPDAFILWALQMIQKYVSKSKMSLFT
jgi:hypothetical protein